jgi:hypothetical protein
MQNKKKDQTKEEKIEQFLKSRKNLQDSNAKLKFSQFLIDSTKDYLKLKFPKKEKTQKNLDFKICNKQNVYSNYKKNSCLEPIKLKNNYTLKEKIDPLPSKPEPKPENDFVPLSKNVLNLRQIEADKLKQKREQSLNLTGTSLFKPAKTPQTQRPSAASNPINQTLQKDLEDWQFPAPDPQKFFGQIKPEKETKTKAKSPTKQTKNSLFTLISEAFSPKIKNALKYSIIFSLILIFFPVVMIAIKGFEEKDNIESAGREAYGSLKQAQASIANANIEKAGADFDLAYQNFLQTRKKIDEIGGSVTGILKFIPGVSKVESGRRLASFGENISLAGKEVTEILKFILINKNKVKNNIFANEENSKINDDLTLTQMIIELEARMKKATEYVENANKDAKGINPNDFPKEEREKIILLKQTLPKLTETLAEFEKYSDLFLEILGKNGSRKYLILFQNNHEMRATGGFIGTYGIVKVYDGQIENLKIEGIYNPDGQLKEKIIPPKPIQKMIPHFTMHDANWWPDFPTSAEKICYFYEKTGGPTVDGVITLTPDVIRDLLEITGPITVPGYGKEDEITVNKDNFYEVIQQEVEINYDKELNQPKKVISDLTPLIMEKVLSSPPDQWPLIFEILNDSLTKRHLMFYSFDYKIQQLISKMGWSGEILESEKDYLSVINTNIASQKTDGVIEQEINHQAEIQPDGTILVDLTIKRIHNGGDSEYEWFNAINSNWMRIYVPKGSKLISAEGFTKEFTDPPLNYENLNFKTDIDVEEMEAGYQIDENSATRIYEEKDKTVFANWVYTYPGESSTVKLKYLLPFQVKLNSLENQVDTYSLLVQKQAGFDNTQLTLKLTGLDHYKYVYRYPEEMKLTESGWNIETTLDQDVFQALIFQEKEK